MTSNVAERLFSRAKHVLSQYRMRIFPRHLEGQIFLMVNESFWDVELVEQTVLIVSNCFYCFLLR